MRTRIAMNEAIDSHEDASATDDIVQAIDPRAELVRLLDSHGDSVVRRLHAEKVAKDGVLPFASPRDPAAVLAGLRPAMDRIASRAAMRGRWQKARPDPQTPEVDLEDAAPVAGRERLGHVAADEHRRPAGERLLHDEREALADAGEHEQISGLIFADDFLRRQPSGKAHGRRIAVGGRHRPPADEGPMAARQIRKDGVRSCLLPPPRRGGHPRRTEACHGPDRLVGSHALRMAKGKT